MENSPTLSRVFSVDMKKLLKEIRACTICKDLLPAGPRPVVQLSSISPILIVGQAPGSKVHASGKPFDDKSGAELRKWLGVEESLFYDDRFFSMLPMGFCYPGKSASGDLPPRPECSHKWHPVVLPKLKRRELTLLVGWYAQKYYLEKSAKNNLTETVKHFRDYLPDFFPLVHPSPRNTGWRKNNPWFGEEVLPALKQRVKSILLAHETITGS
jgi:uracil-DNA glycosylase